MSYWSRASSLVTRPTDPQTVMAYTMIDWNRYLVGSLEGGLHLLALMPSASASSSSSASAARTADQLMVGHPGVWHCWRHDSS